MTMMAILFFEFINRSARPFCHRQTLLINLFFHMKLIQKLIAEPDLYRCCGLSIRCRSFVAYISHVRIFKAKLIWIELHSLHYIHSWWEWVMGECLKHKWKVVETMTVTKNKMIESWPQRTIHSLGFDFETFLNRFDSPLNV